MTSLLEADPEILQAVDELRSSSTEERRCAPRKPFRVVQRIAQATGRRVPEPSTFFPVKCCDLSTRGFSFSIKRRPQFESIVLALGTPPDVIYLAAEIKHCTEMVACPSGRVEVLDEQGAETDHEDPGIEGVERSFVVGCEFTGRLELEEDRETAEQ